MLGTVLEINDQVVDSPDLVNSSPFDDGWLVKVTRRATCPPFSLVTSTSR